MKLFVSASEASADMHGAAVVTALKEKLKSQGRELTYFKALGGDALRASGAELFMHLSQFSVMGGVSELASKWPNRRRLEVLIETELSKLKQNGAALPDCALLIDGSAINLRLAALFKFFSVPVVYLIPPKVWVWRTHRVFKLQQLVDRVLTILPFEAQFLEACGVKASYVGNPIVEQIPWSLSRKTAREALQLNDTTHVVACFLGSRHSEIKHHTKTFRDALVLYFAKRLERQSPLEDAAVVVPLPAHLDVSFVKQHFGDVLKIMHDVEVPVRFVSADGNYQVLKASDVGLIKSGTSTLEAAALGLPHVVSYDMSLSSRFIYKYIVRYGGYIGLGNLVLASSFDDALTGRQPVFEECILKTGTPDQISEGLLRAPERFRQNHARVASLREILSGGFKSPADEIAKHIVDLVS